MTFSETFVSSPRFREELERISAQTKELRFALALRAYNPAQPRDEIGRWTELDRVEGRPANGTRLAEVISVCTIDGGRSSSFDEYGNPTYVAHYLCPGGQRFSRSGFGKAPGIVRDPFR